MASVDVLCITVVHKAAHILDNMKCEIIEKLARSLDILRRRYLKDESAAAFDTYGPLLSSYSPVSTTLNSNNHCLACDMPDGHACRDELGIVTRTVCAMFATAVPKLAELHLFGCCWDVALQCLAFAAHNFTPCLCKP